MGWGVAVLSPSLLRIGGAGLAKKKQLTYKERLEQIGNKLVNLALSMEKQAKEEGHISPTIGNAMTNALRSSADIYKYLDSGDTLSVIVDESSKGLSRADKKRLDEIIKLLSEP